MAAKPALVRVKRRRQDPAPEDLVLEASERSAPLASDPANALAALALSAPAQKKRRFQLVTTVSGGHTAADNLIQQLSCLPTAQQHRKQQNHHEGMSAGNTAIYRQVPSASRTQGNIHQHFKVYDLIHEVASPKPSQLFSGPDEASILANYYPLVQRYLRQQHCQEKEQGAANVQPQEQHESATPLQAESDDGFVYDYYAAVADAQTEAGVDLAHVPTVQVRDDENWWNAPADAGSSDDQSEDPNAEDWYGNDYPEDDESADSLPSSFCPTETSFDD